jgi:(2Fe-2S) ferredoxin
VPKKVSIAERLLTRIKITERGCWEWQGARQPPWGYGFFKHDQIVMRAHRASFEEFRYPIPDGLSICHTCDNPCCVYPLHLFPGTTQDNVDDCKQKGRTKTGEKHWNNRLTEDQAKEIIRRHHAGEKPKDLAEEFGTSADNIWQISAGIRWKHLPRPVKEKSCE